MRTASVIPVIAIDDPEHRPLARALVRVESACWKNLRTKHA